MLEHPFYIRIPTQNEASFFASRSAAEAVISVVIAAQKKGWMRLHGFVVMPEGLEMVTTPIRQGVAGLVAHLEAESIPTLMVLLPEGGMIWGPRHFQTPLTTQRALDARLDMLLLAPVASDLSASAAGYPYSSANPRYSTMVAPFAGFQKATVPAAPPANETPADETPTVEAPKAEPQTG